MTRTLKTDFHLHTHHSDNRDRMTPADYVQLARRYGYDVLGFCDHHHNLTQASWAALQEEVRAEITQLARADLLLTTGYEATWMTGHLCVLGKQSFDGESITDCDRQMWSPANTRILAHPDNNICAWHLPLPVAIQGVEVINGGQDPYSVYVGSPCNGLATFQRYLLLNHKVAVIAQSDCHQRGVFGRVWTGVMVDEGAPLHWQTVAEALQQGHTFAAMGDLPIRVWTENNCLPGDTLVEAGVNTLLWKVPEGAKVTVYVADRPVAHFRAATGEGAHTLSHNGPHWLLVKRGLAWAVSTPIWVSNQGVTTVPTRELLAHHAVVQARVDALRRRVDWLAALDVTSEQTPYPVAHYVAWLNNLLPSNWADVDPAFSGPGDPVDWAMARLHHAQEIVMPILRDLCRARHRNSSHSIGGSSVLVTAPNALLPRGTYRATVDLPAHFGAPALATMTGERIPSLPEAIAGERDPLFGNRSRVQMNELVTWLARGEIHEYQMRDCQLVCEDGALRLVADLWPAVLGNAPQPNPDAAARLEAAIADPSVQSFFVHLRMPRRYALFFELDEDVQADTLMLKVIAAGEGDEGEAANKRTIRFFLDDALASDPSELSLVVQLT